ncbi:hypothetical protein JCM24511_05510 [Saitozyma sp. JCM 24511]|nr:hypothetical protein JCM24511_05510 [Saitozyma sp. JCM 24511]
MAVAMLPPSSFGTIGPYGSPNTSLGHPALASSLSRAYTHANTPPTSHFPSYLSQFSPYRGRSAPSSTLSRSFPFNSSGDTGPGRGPMSVPVMVSVGGEQGEESEEPCDWSIRELEEDDEEDWEIKDEHQDKQAGRQQLYEDEDEDEDEDEVEDDEEGDDAHGGFRPSGWESSDGQSRAQLWSSNDKTPLAAHMARPHPVPVAPVPTATSSYPAPSPPTLPSPSPESDTALALYQPSASVETAIASAGWLQIDHPDSAPQMSDTTDTVSLIGATSKLASSCIRSGARLTSSLLESATEGIAYIANYADEHGTQMAENIAMGINDVEYLSDVEWDRLVICGEFGTPETQEPIDNIAVIMSTLVDPASVPLLDTVKLEEKPSADGVEQVATHGEKASVEQADSTISTPELINAGSVPSELENGDDEAETSSLLSFSGSHLPAVLDTRAVVEDGSENESVDGSVKGVDDDASGVEVMSVTSDSREPCEADANLEFEDLASDPVCVGGYRLESDPAITAAQAVHEGRTTLHEPRSSSPFAGASGIGTDILDVSDPHVLRKSISERLAEFSTSVSTWYDLTARPALVSLVETLRPFAIEVWTHGPSVLRHAALGTLRTVESVSRSVRGWLDDEEEGGSKLHFSKPQSLETSRHVDIDGPRPDSDNTSTSPA